MKALVVYSSRTGNTEKIARAIHAAMPRGTGLAGPRDAPDPEGFDFIALGFWVDKGNADAQSLEYIKKIREKKVGLFMTLGARPDSEHAKKCMNSVKALLEPRNTVIREFVCQGKIDPALTKMFESFPADHPHAMTDERRARHEEAAKHPDENDLARAAACFENIAVEPENPR
ncbi:MAG: flavodoxin family protein [Spirochaetales bacterium]|jgi:flavodoxin|nr:flavodoxin family protein [Spirochaetales bacterium]